MANELRLTVLDIADVTPLFDRMKVFRAEAADGVYAELTNPTSRIPLVPGQIEYLYSDTAGGPQHWYCTTYFNSVNRAESSRTAPRQVGSDPALTLVPVDYLLQNYLVGLRMKDRQNKDLPIGIYETSIRAAVAWVESKTGLCLAPRLITDERHDFNRSMVEGGFWLDSRKIPIQSVQALRLALPGGTPSPIPPQWLQWDSLDGSVEVVPGGSIGAPTAFPYGGIGSAFYWGARDRIPGALRLDYVAGWAEGQLPADLLDVVCKAACLSPLAIAGDMIGPVGASSRSISIDGLSQSLGTTNNASGNYYAARMTTYGTQIQDQIQTARTTYRAMSMKVVG